MLEFSDQVVEAMEGMKGSAEADVKRTKSISSMFATYLCDMLMANQCCDTLKHIARTTKDVVGRDVVRNQLGFFSCGKILCARTG